MNVQDAIHRRTSLVDTQSRGHDPSRRWRTLPVAITLGFVLLAAVLGWLAWDNWVVQPWTRDGRVRVYVVSMAPEVAGRIVQLKVKDNQYVQRGDVLMVIDPSDYAIAVATDEAALKQAIYDARNKGTQADRRRQLTTLSTSTEERQNYATGALEADTMVQQAQSRLAQARVNLERTQMHASANGWVTNLQARVGDYATVGQRNIAVVDADSFWIDGYFEETALARIHDGDTARIYLMGYRKMLRGHVDSLARGIQVPNAQPDASGLAHVNPIFTWVRLAQRIPIRIQFDDVPPDVRLVAGLTATVEVHPKPVEDRP